MFYASIFRFKNDPKCIQKEAEKSEKICFWPPGGALRHEQAAQGAPKATRLPKMEPKGPPELPKWRPRGS